MSASFSAERLDRLRAFLRTRPRGITAADADAIAAGIDRFFGQRCSLDEAMGLQLDCGENHPGSDMAIAKRNAALRAAGAMLGNVNRANSREVACRLAEYHNSGWFRERLHETCPPNRLGQIEGHFWAALRAWPRLIGERQIHLILTAPLEVKPPF